jgi:hypothetical protein
MSYTGMCYNQSYWVTLLSNSLHTNICKERQLYVHIYIYAFIRVCYIYVLVQPMCFNLRLDNLYVCFSTPYRNFPWFCKCVLPHYPSCVYCTGHCTVSLNETLGSRLYSRLQVTGQYKLVYTLTEVFRFLFLPMYRTVLSVFFPCCWHTGSVSYSYLSANLQALEFSYLFKHSMPDYRHFRWTVHK